LLLMFARYCLLVVLSIACARAGWNDTSTGIDLNRLRHPKIVRLRTGTVAPGKRVVFDGIELTMNHEVWPEAILRGRGKSGKPWTVTMCGACVNEIWRADLDGNGRLDYVFSGGGPFFNGRMTPLYSLSFLLMDEDAMPVPFFTAIYYGEKAGEGIKQLIQLDGGIRLLISDYDEQPSDARVGPGCSGHWVTQAYRFTNTSVERAPGAFAGFTFPFIHPWTYFGTDCLFDPNGHIEQPVLMDMSTSNQGALVTRLLEKDGPRTLAIAPVAACQTVTTSASMIVMDTKAGREIAFPTLYGEAQDRVADKIRLANLPVELRGVNDCRATMMWAHSNP
jgi:hypothetical protein